jgi:hypothetical protein
VTATLPGLVGEQTYHYRLVAGNGEPGIIGKGGDKTITPHNVKALTTEAASEVTRTTAQLNATFEGNGEETTYFFEYGTTTGYGSRMPAEPTEASAGSPASGINPMSVMVTGLTPETTYHFRVVGKNGAGSSVAGDRTFTTPVAVQDVTAKDATNLTSTTATINGSFTGNGESHTYRFEWGPTASYGKTIEGEAGSGVGTVEVSAGVSGLEPNLPTSQPYHFRLIVTNSTGSTASSDHVFFAAPPDLPAISGVGVVASPSSAALSAKINPGNGETVFFVQYGPDTSYGSSSPISDPIGDDGTDHPVETTLTGLTPANVYHYRFVALNFGGVNHSTDQTFITPDRPKIETTVANAIGQTSASLSALVAGNASPTNVHFEYGASNAYGLTTGQGFAGQSLVAEQVTAALAALVPGTTYHYRTVAVNGIGTTYGPEQTFTTLPVAEEQQPETNQCAKGMVKRGGKCKCPKGKVKRKNKCVKKKKHNSKHRKHGHGKRNG